MAKKIITIPDYLQMAKGKAPIIQKPGKNKKTPIAIQIIAAVVVLGVVLLLFFPNIFKKNEVDSEYIFRKDGTLTFADSANQVKTKIDIQIAANDFDRELGLMYRKHMEENRGMLFIFPNEDVQNFWMRNTFIPLDMIFVNSKKDIVTIQHATQTLSDQSYSSVDSAQYVIEVNSGFCSKYNIKIGDRISWDSSK